MVDLFCARMVFAIHALLDKVVGNDAEIAFEFLYRLRVKICNLIQISIIFILSQQAASNTFYGINIIPQIRLNCKFFTLFA
jgi:hypothetical protein